MGVDGLRLDAVPYLYEREGTSCENLPETHAFLRELRRRLDAKYEDRMLLAEANQWPEDAVAYFGDGDECHMAFHFPVMPRLFMAVQQEDRFPMIDILQQTPAIPETCAVGRRSSGTTTSSPSRWSPTRTGTTCTGSTPAIRRRASTWASAGASRRSWATTAGASS